MSAPLHQLPFVNLYVRLDQPDTPLYRSQEQGQTMVNQIVPEAFWPVVEQFGVNVRATLKDSNEGAMTVDGVRMIVMQQKMADGSVWACAQRINAELMKFQNLGFAPHILNHIGSLGERAGLIVISGSSGQGKTTTAAALLVHFLETYGGLAFTVESPIEYILKGRHGTLGQCFQLEVNGAEAWADMIEHAARWNPRYLFVGNVRTPEAAKQLIQAAATGHTVITTIHGSTPEEALTSLLYLAEPAMGAGTRDILGGAMTALIHQTLKEDGPFVHYLFTEEGAAADPVRALIRENKIGMMSTYIDRVAARLAHQMPKSPPPAMQQPRPPLPPLPPIRK
ncbi:MAG: Flp pilus assembly complex ATPase component TadA [Alphaproteobacteria bacterium]|nr:Flp pilus assembly complex ATPase component TadA [Alphaproteobacteria bacterium]